MENRSIGWRYVLETTEDFVRNKQQWPVNIKTRQKEEEAKKEEEEQEQKDQAQGQGQQKEQDNQPNENSKDKQPQQEHEWKKDQGENKHHNAYGGSAASGQPQDEHSKEKKAEYEKLLEKYTPQEIALLRSLRHEKAYMANLEQNDGKGKSPQTRNRTQISIDEADQFSPDNWLPRSPDLIRLTGKHPLNAEAQLLHLFEAG